MMNPVSIFLAIAASRTGCKARRNPLALTAKARRCDVTDARKPDGLPDLVRAIGPDKVRYED
jgi:hypothetical protein